MRMKTEAIEDKIRSLQAKMAANGLLMSGEHIKHLADLFYEEAGQLSLWWNYFVNLTELESRFIELSCGDNSFKTTLKTMLRQERQILARNIWHNRSKSIQHLLVGQQVWIILSVVIALAAYIKS